MTDKNEKGSWLWERCYSCGHRLRFASNGCPQCGEMFDGRDEPETWLENCSCPRCLQARFENT